MAPSRTVALVLAAGGGTRFAASGGTGPKVLAEVGGRALVVGAVAAAVEAGIGPVAVVVQPGQGLVGRLPGEVAVVENPRWAEGMATSVQAGLAWAATQGAAAAVIGMGDQPGVQAEAWRRVAAATATSIAVATYGGRRANPVRLAAEAWPLLPTTGDEGARSLLRRRSDLVAEVPCPGSGADVDTLGDLETWSS